MKIDFELIVFPDFFCIMLSSKNWFVLKFSLWQMFGKSFSSKRKLVWSPIFLCKTLQGVNFYWNSLISGFEWSIDYGCGVLFCRPMESILAHEMKAAHCTWTVLDWKGCGWSMDVSWIIWTWGNRPWVGRLGVRIC